MSNFGDFTELDALSRERADPEAVVRWLRQHFGKRAKITRLDVIIALLAHLHREGSG